MSGLLELLAACGIEAHSHGEEAAKFVCKCGGAADLADMGERVWHYCPKCAPGPGRGYTATEFLARFRRPGAEGGAAEQALTVYPLGDFLALELPTPEAVIGGLFLAGTVAIVYGPPGSGKSWLGAEACRAVSCGRPFLGAFDTVRGPALLVEQESSPALLQARLRDLEQGEPRPADAATVYVVPLCGLAFDEDGRKALRAAVKETGAKFLLVDTLGATLGPTDPLDPRQARALMAYLRDLAVEFVCAVVLLAHTPKHASAEPLLSSIFGSQEFGAAVDAAFETSTLPGAPPSFRVCCTKQRWLPPGEWPDFSFTLQDAEHGGKVLTSAQASTGVARIILQAAEGEDFIPAKDLIAQSVAGGFTDRAARKTLADLHADGKLLLDPNSTPRNRAFKRAEP